MSNFHMASLSGSSEATFSNSALMESTYVGILLCDGGK
jgi:hypothetical protein